MPPALSEKSKMPLICSKRSHMIFTNVGWTSGGSTCSDQPHLSVSHSWQSVFSSIPVTNSDWQLIYVLLYPGSQNQPTIFGLTSAKRYTRLPQFLQADNVFCVFEWPEFISRYNDSLHLLDKGVMNHLCFLTGSAGLDGRQCHQPVHCSESSPLNYSPRSKIGGLCEPLLGWADGGSR